jgi:phenylpyruvate tautomerase PptA (4-oxalocrotonate tautomerase family)
MPLTRISIPTCLPQQKARALADAVHEGLVETCNVPPKDRFQFISAYPPEMMLTRREAHTGSIDRRDPVS